MNNFSIGFFAGLLVGVVIMVAILAIPPGAGYKQGQIDAMTGKQVYCLDAQYQWISGEPIDGLKCKNGK